MASQRILRYVLACALVLVLQLAAGQWVAAQESKSSTAASPSALAVSPAIIEEVLTPGKPAAFTVQVNNVTNFPLPIKGYVRDLLAQTADLKKADRDRLDASQWFVLEEPDFILQPHQTRTVKGTIRAPADASPGGHYATIFFQPLLPEGALSPTMAYVNAKVGVLAFLVVKGDITQEASLEGGLGPRGLLRHGPITFTFSIRNTGNVHLMPTGKLKVYDWQDREVGKIDVPIGIILPSTTKEYSVQWQPPSSVGKYRAELTASYGSDAVQLPKLRTAFWIVPWIEIVGTVLIGALTLLFVVKTRRRWHRAWQALRGRH